MSRRRRIIIIEGGNSSGIQETAVPAASLNDPDAEVAIVFDDEVYAENKADQALNAAVIELET